MAGHENIEDARDALLWLAAMGADDATLDAPVNRLSAPAPPDVEPPPRPAVVKAAGTPAADGAAVESARALAAAAQSLEELRAAMNRFDGCALKHSATQLVFADGNPKARLMLVGEAPGRDEDREGRPFVGVSGQLLDRILAAAGFDRTSVYITNVLPWRPPENREPALAEAATCLPFLLRHIELVAPRVVLALGATASRHLFDSAEGITRLRGKWLELDAHQHRCPAMATFHPAALLRNPLNKRYVWRDLLAVTAKLERLA